MGLLSAFVGGATEGVQSHWKDVREQLKEDAKRLFEERMYERKREDSLADTQKQWERDDKLLESDREFKLQQDEARKQSDLEYLERQNEYQMQRINAQHAGDLRLYKAKAAYDRENSANDYSVNYKPNLIDLTDPSDSELKIPNAKIDTKTGAIIDPTGALLKKSYDPAEIDARVDAEVEKRRDKPWSLLTNDDEQAFGEGVTESDFREAFKQQLINESPTVAESRGFDPSSIFTSEHELRNAITGRSAGGILSQSESAGTDDMKSNNKGAEVINGVTLRDGDINFDDGETEHKQPDYGSRPDGTKKDVGFLGELKVPGTDSVATEYSVGVNIDGKEMDIPTLVPTLTDDEVNQVLQSAAKGEMPPKEIIGKATDFAKSRLADGKPVFYQSGEDNKTSKSILTEDEKKLLREFNLDAPETTAPQMRNPYANTDVTGTIGRFFSENAPVTTAAVGRVAEIPGNLARGGMGLLSAAGEGVKQHFHELDVKADERRDRDMARATEYFFSGNPSPEAARMVLKNNSASDKQKAAARAYLKYKGEL